MISLFHIASMASVRTLTEKDLKTALFKHIVWQQKWSRKLEQIIYCGEEAPAMFIHTGFQIIQWHQDKINMIEDELERRWKDEVA